MGSGTYCLKLEKGKIVSSPTPPAGLSKKVLLGCKHGALKLEST